MGLRIDFNQIKALHFLVGDKHAELRYADETPECFIDGKKIELRMRFNEEFRCDEVRIGRGDFEFLENGIVYLKSHLLTLSDDFYIDPEAAKTDLEELLVLLQSAHLRGAHHEAIKSLTEKSLEQLDVCRISKQWKSSIGRYIRQGKFFRAHKKVQGCMVIYEGRDPPSWSDSSPSQDLIAA